jgi:Domain of unknown function (DUF1902)
MRATQFPFSIGEKARDTNFIPAARLEIGSYPGFLRLSFPVGAMCYRPSLPHVGGAISGANMTKPVIFTISASWDEEAGVWTGHCDDIPAAADAPSLDALLDKIAVMALDLLPDNHPGIDPASVFVQITALREAEPAAA